jgi:hypothetical protein
MAVLALSKSLAAAVNAMLCGAARRVIFRIEKYHQFASLEIAQAEGLVAAGGQRKIWGFIANF